MLASTSSRTSLALAALTSMTLVPCASFVACDDGATSPDTEVDGDMATTDSEMDTHGIDFRGVDLAIEDVAIVPNPSNALSYFVEWRTNEPATSTLFVACGDDYETSVETGTAEPALEHSAFVQGLYDGASCAVTIEADSAIDDQTAQHQGAFEVGPLPEWLPELEIVTAAPDQMADGWTQINLTNGFDGVRFTAALVDADGRYRWYHQVGAPSAGEDNEVRVYEDGVLICGVLNVIHPMFVDWTGSVQWKHTVGMHHDCRLNADRTRLRYLQSRPDGCPNDERASQIVEWDLENDEEVWRWRICDHWLPDTLTRDWSHVNTIEPFPDENAILISSRNQHTLFKVDRETDDVVWGLGLKGDFDIAPEDQFYRQHAPEIQPDGNLVLFDNGRFGDREYSRLIEIAYDETDMTAEVVWEYTPDPPIFAPIWGDADRLPNGNTLGTFGLRSETERTHVIEVDPDGDEVWHLQMPLKWGSYRADRVTNMPLSYATGESQ